MINVLMKHDHDEGDRQLAAVEDDVARARWREAAMSHAAFCAAIETHFRAEEDLLFPALEAIVGDGFGPTAVMRHEHARVRTVLGEMERALAAQDDITWFAQADSLRILLQQHNLKEESMLYPFAERALGSAAAAMAGSLRDALTGVPVHG